MLYKVYKMVTFYADALWARHAILTGGVRDEL